LGAAPAGARPTAAGRTTGGPAGRDLPGWGPSGSGSIEQLPELGVHQFGRDGTRVLVRERAVRADEERLGHPGQAVVDAGAAVVVDHAREGEAELADEREALRLVPAVLGLDAQDERLVAVLLPRLLQHGRLVAAGGAPLRPEVDDHRAADRARL